MTFKKGRLCCEAFLAQPRGIIMKYIITGVLGLIFSFPTFAQNNKEEAFISNFKNNLIWHSEQALPRCAGQGDKTPLLFFKAMDNAFNNADFVAVWRDNQGRSVFATCLSLLSNSITLGEIDKPFKTYVSQNPDSHLIRLLDLQKIADDLKQKKQYYASLSGKQYSFNSLKDYESAKSALEAYYINEIAQSLHTDKRLQISQYYANAYPNNTMITQQYYDAILRKHDGFDMDAFYQAVQEGIAGTDPKAVSTLYYQALGYYIKKDALKLKAHSSFNQKMFDIGAVNYVTMYPGEVSTMNSIQNACDYQSKPLYDLLLKKAKHDKGLANVMNAERYHDCETLKK